MPIYEFRCTDCDTLSEKICRTTLAVIECPDCQGKAERIVSLFSGQSMPSTISDSACLPGSGFT